MIYICKNCWEQCDGDYYEDGVYNADEEWISFGDSLCSSCCHSPIISIDEEELEEIAESIEHDCFTFDESLERYGDIAYYIAENLTFIPGYDEN